MGMKIFSFAALFLIQYTFSQAQSCAPCTSPGCAISLFTVPGTILVNTTVTATNLSSCAGSYFWNLCSGNLTQTPTGVNLGNLGVTGSWDYYPRVQFAFDGTNYYSFTSMFIQGNLTRSNFGNSLLNTPTSSNLGNFGGTITGYMEGLQIKKENGNWYVFGVSGNPNRFYRLNFGNSLGNTATATSFGTIGGLNFPHGLNIVQDIATQHWYGFTVNRANGTLTRFYFGNSLTNTPTGVNLGNIGGMSGSTALYVIYSGTNWYGFVTNGYTNSISRLSFGSSLANTPTGTNLGNIGGLNSPYDITIISDCNSTIGLVTNNWNGTSTAPSDVIRVTFPSGLSGPLVGTSLGNFGGFKNPEGISDIYRDNSTGNLYALVANGGGGTGGSISRIRFNVCTTSSIATSTSASPPVWSYSASGTYNVSLTINQGTIFEKSYCQPVNVVTVLNSSDLEVSGHIDQNRAILMWSKGDLSNLKSFVVEKMKGSSVSVLTEIPVNEASSNHFSIIDASYEEYEDSYYRVLTKNSDNSQDASQWISLKKTKEIFANIAPNPVENNSVLVVQSNLAWEKYAIFNSNGTNVLNGFFNNNQSVNRYSIHINGLPSGVYFLSLENGQDAKYLKLIVK